ncbi:MAG: CDP-glucose 4,6-dehydratase [Candidatus Baltobacteraceae bacterium]
METDLKKAFTGRRVFLTGHTGFKGSWLVAMLRALGADVHGYALDPPSHPSLFDEAHLSQDCIDRRADIRDTRALAAAIEVANPEVLFHLAAQPLVLSGLQSPVETFEINAQGTVHVLEAVRAAPGIRAAVIVTTDKCYAPGKDRPLREDDALGGDDPYSASKACAELAVEAYRASFFAKGPIVASARAGNVIGGGDWAQYRLLADLARAMTADRRIVLRHPGAVRPWQHVFDACFGYLMLAARALDGDRGVARAWNFGPDDAGHFTVAQVVEAFARAYGETIDISIEPGAAHENPVLRLDSQQAREILGWQPFYDMHAAVDATARWYRERAIGTNVRSLLLTSVEALFARAGSLA